MFNLPNGKEVHDFEFIDSGQERFWIIMCSNAIYRLESTIQDVSYAGMTTIGDKNKWSCSDLSGVPIVNHPENTPGYRDWETDRKSTRLNSSHLKLSRMPSSA